MKELTLFQPPNRPWKSPNLSPFCAKLECYLRMAEIPYQVRPMQIGKAPKGKIPYVALPDGQLLGDSQLVIEHLERAVAAEGKPALDDGMSAAERAVGHLVRRTLEEAFYFVAVYIRWRSDDGYAVMRDAFKQFIPGIVVPFIRRGINKKLDGQGTGRHSFEEATAFGAADLEACAELLGDKPFLFGDRPRTADCTLFAFVEGVLAPPIDSPIKASVAARGNLVAYRQRVRERWWKDLDAAAPAG